MDKVRNEEVRRRAEIETSYITSREDQRVLRWFGRVKKRMSTVWSEGC